MKSTILRSKLFAASAMIILFGFIANLSFAQSGARTLKGTSYKIELTGTNTSEKKADVISFTDKMFESGVAKEHGFTQTSYIEKLGTNSISFQAIFSSDKEGTMTWSGSVKDGKVNGRLLWIKNGNERVIHTFEGEAIPAEKSPEVK